MPLPIKSIFSCLVLLSTTSDIHSQLIHKYDNPQKLVEKPRDKSVWKFLLGSGAEPSQLPILMYSTNSNGLDVSVYIESKKKCDFTFSPHTNTLADAETIKQLTDNKIVFIWNEKKDKQIVNTRISILDIGTCSIKKNLEFPWDLKVRENHLEVVTYADGFDVFTSSNSRLNYDNGGNQIGEPGYFPIYSDQFNISKASDKLSFNGFYILDHKAATLKLVKVDGKLVQTLAESLPAKVFINEEQSLYSVCSWDTKKSRTVNCLQYDQSGSNTLNGQEFEFLDGQLDVKNLARGKLVFVAWSIEGNKFNFVKMESGEKAKYWYYDTLIDPIIFKNVRLMNLNEKEQTFLVTYESVSEVILQKFFLFPYY